MAIGANQQKDVFQARLNRIQAVSAAASAESVQVEAPRRVSRKTKAVKATQRTPLRLSRGVLLGLAIGLGSVLIGRVVTFQCQGEASFYLDLLAKTGPYSIIAGLLFVLMVGLGLRDKPHVIGIAAGLPLMYFGEPYLAHFAMDLWMQMYSPEYVDTMLIQAGLRLPPAL